MDFLHTPLNWYQAEDVIRNNELGKFKRSFEELTKYRQHRANLKRQGIPSINKLLADELGWVQVDKNYKIISKENLKAKSTKLLNHSDDIKITMNRFPYHFTKDIAHLLVWTKIPISNDPKSPIGDISPQTRRTINNYITKLFVSTYGIPQENILWFRNWTELQSIKEFSHIHVLIKALSHEKIQEILQFPNYPTALEEHQSLEASAPKL